MINARAKLRVYRLYTDDGRDRSNPIQTAPLRLSDAIPGSRRPYLALADALGLSVNAVHKRIKSMVEESVIRGFTTKFSLSRARIGFGTPNKIRILKNSKQL